MSRALVVAGTDTDVGKTVFAAGLAAALGAAYWKPVQAGLEEGGDAATATRLGARTVPEIYRLNTPCSPDRAAQIDGIAIDPERLVPPADRPLVIEAAGGVLVPLTRDLLFADLFARWRLPVILVARTALGTINHSLMSVEALRARGVPILGIAFSGDAVEHSEATTARIGGVKRLGRLPHLAPLDADTLATAFAAQFDLADFR